MSLKQRLLRIASSDALSLCAVLVYVVYKFLQSTTFPLVYTNTFRYVFAVLLLGGGPRYLIQLWGDLKKREGKRERLRLLGRHALVWCAAVPFVAVAVRTNYPDLIAWVLGMMCLWRMRPEKVLRAFALEVGALLSATVVCCLAGVIRNISSVALYGSYGIVNTTDFAAYFIFLLLCIWCTQRVRTWYTTFLFALLCALVAAGTNNLVGSRTSQACCLMLVVAVLWEWLGSRGAKVVDALCVCAFPLVSVVLGWLAYLYGQGNAKAQELDIVLSRRLSATWGVYQEQGIHLLGKDFTMHGQGGSMLGSGTTYNFLDSAQEYLLIRLGILVFVLVMALWMWTTLRAADGGRRRISLAMAIIAVYGFSEVQLINVNYCIFLLMPFCAFGEPVRETEDQAAAERGWLASVGTGVGMCALCWMLAPKALSWLRTFFFLRSWNVGMRTLRALALCVILVVCLHLLWKLLPRALSSKEKRPCIAFGMAAAVLAGGALFVNLTIEQGLRVHAAELDAEQPFIEAVLSSASGPVYAFEKSELYQRRFGGLTEHAMVVDALAKERAGTMIVDKGNEDMRLQTMGASYAQFADESGMYTYDPAVVDAVTAAGGTWSAFYTSERTVNLGDLAQLNGLPIDKHGGVVLDDSGHGTAETRQMDQLGGTYEVRVAVSADPTELASWGDKPVCTLRVTGSKGEIPIFDAPITAADFDETGVCTATFTYATSNMPRVAFALEAADGVQLILNELAWRRIA